MRSRRRSDNQPRTCFVNPATPEAQTVTSAEANKMFENGIRHRGQWRFPPSPHKKQTEPSAQVILQTAKTNVIHENILYELSKQGKEGEKETFKNFLIH